MNFLDADNDVSNINNSSPASKMDFFPVLWCYHINPITSVFVFDMKFYRLISMLHYNRSVDIALSA